MTLKPRACRSPRLCSHLFDARVRHNKSVIRSNHVHVAFGSGAKLLLDADLDARDPPGLESGTCCAFTSRAIAMHRTLRVQASARGEFATL